MPINFKHIITEFINKNNIYDDINTLININNNIPNILEEWSYRSENGYPDINNINDITKLESILKQYMPHNITNINNMLLLEQSNSYELSDLQALINSDDIQLDAKTIKNIIKIINADKFQLVIQDKLSTEKHMSQSIINSIISLAIEYECYEELQTLILNNKYQIGFNSLAQDGNLYTICDDNMPAGITFPIDFMIAVSELTPSQKGVAVGKFEYLLNLFVANSSKADGGDLKIGSDICEIKGTGARLRGQKGYGNGASVSKYFLNEVNKIYKSKSKTIPDDIQQKINKTKQQMWYQSANDIWINDLLSDMLLQKYITPNQVKLLLKKSLLELYINIDDKSLTSFINTSFKITDSYFNININKIQTNWIALELEYYNKIEPFKWWIMIKQDGDYFLIKDAFDYNSLTNTISNKFKIAGWPNTKPTATSQDSVCRVILK